MSLIIDLRPETEAYLSRQAERRGVPLAEYVQRLLEAGVPVQPRSDMSPAERAAAWRESVKGLPQTTPLSDEAMSRESMYDTRG